MEISHVPVSKSLGNCEHLYNQMSSESLGEFEKVRTRLPQSPSTSHAGGSAHFSWQHFIKDRGLCTGITLCTRNRAIFTQTDTQGKPRPCLIYDARHEKDFSYTLGRSERQSVEGVERESSEDHSWMISQMKLYYNPFSERLNVFMQHVCEICCRVTDRNSTCFAQRTVFFWDFTGFEGNISL